MALTTYAELLTAIQNWVKPNTTLSAAEVALIPDYVRLFEAEANKTLMHPRMDAIGTLTFTSGSAPIPSDLLNVKKIQLTSSPWTILDVDDSDIPAASAGYSTGSATKYQWVGGVIVANTSASFSAGIRYRASLSALSSGVNWLFTTHPDLYLFGSIVQADIRFIDQEQLALAQSRYDRGLAMFNNMAALAHAGQLQIQPSTRGP